MKKLFEIKRYMALCSMGVVSMLFQLLIFNLLRRSLGPEVANVIGIECAIILSFLLNNIVTFRDRRMSREDALKKWFVKLMQFNAFSMGSLLIQLVVITLGVRFIGRGVVLENSLVIFGVFLGSIYNYFIYSYVIWRH